MTKKRISADTIYPTAKAILQHCNGDNTFPSFLIEEAITMMAWRSAWLLEPLPWWWPCPSGATDVKEVTQ